jgi:hypothetical protein
MSKLPLVQRWLQASIACSVVAVAVSLSAQGSPPPNNNPAGKSSATKAAEVIPAGQRLFYCSHSLMWDTPAPLGEAASAYGIKDHVLVGLERIGFSTTKQHWDQPDAGNQSKQALLTGKVDDFIMSPMEMPDEGIDNFVKFGLKKNPKMRFFVQNNWAAFNIDGQGAHSKGMASMGGMDKWDNTTAEQIPKLNATSVKLYEDQVDKINNDIGHTVIWIIPTDQANEALRIKVAKNEFPGVEKQSQLFRDPIGHPGPVLQALNSYVHFATIYGVSPVGLPLPTILKNANNPKWDDDFNKRLQEIAWDAVIHYSYSGVKVPAAARQ